MRFGEGRGALACGTAVAALVGLPALAAPLLRAPDALGAKPKPRLRVRDAAHLHLTSGGANNVLNEIGKAKGTLPGTVRVSLDIHTYTAGSSFTITTRDGSISGKGTAKIKTGKGEYASFGGGVSVTRGTGRFAHASGSGGLYGTINRRDDAMTVTVTGTLRLYAAKAAAARTPRVKLTARFTPDRPGRSTTVRYGIRIAEPEPLRSLELRLPAGMGFAKSSLGLKECSPAVLVKQGAGGCPSNSFIGHGSLAGELVAEEPIDERASVTVVLGPSTDRGRQTMLFFVEGIYPVSEERILYAHLLPSARPFSDLLSTEVPLIPSWSGGPDVELVSLRATIGPAGLRYYYTEHGRRIEFTPRGLDVPQRCPRLGYPVQARLSWWGVAGTATASTRVPCGRRR